MRSAYGVIGSDVRALGPRSGPRSGAGARASARLQPGQRIAYPGVSYFDEPSDPKTASRSDTCIYPTKIYFLRFLVYAWRVKRDHPVWGLMQVVVVCGTLLVLQVQTATSWDARLDGEAGKLGGVVLVSVLVEWIRQRKGR